MDLTPRTLRDVEFRERRFGGYDPDDVDGFLERAAAALEVLMRRVVQAEERATRAEQQLIEGEESVRRTLVLAQRTADAALQEAEEQAAALRSEAERLHAEARSEHERVLEIARVEAQSLADQAHEQARAAAHEAQQRVHHDLQQLDRRRSELEADIAALHDTLEAERARLRAVLVDQLHRLDEGLPPPLDSVAAPPPLDQRPEGSSAPTASPEGIPEDTTAEDVLAAGDDASTYQPIHDPVPADGRRAEGTFFDQEAVPSDASDGAGRAIDESDDVPGEHVPGEATDDADAEVRGDFVAAAVTRPEIAGREEEVGVHDDPYLASLREAVDDTSPLGPRDDDAFFGSPGDFERDEPDGGGRGKGLFRRRH